METPIITSAETKCTCCLLHPIAKESTSEPQHEISLLAHDLIRIGAVDPPKISFQTQNSSAKNYTSRKNKWQKWVKSMACKKKFSEKWHQAGINDSILASSVSSDIRIDQQTIEALIGFWCSITNTFMFPWGETAFTPEDVFMFTFLPLRGSELNRKLTKEEEELQNRLIVEAAKILVLNKDAKCSRNVTQDIWLNWFINEKDIDDELRHLGFLTYWLCTDVFGLANPTVAAIFVLAARLSLGDRIPLAPALVANIYHELNTMTKSIAGNQLKKLKVWAPIGILQCWVWERFERLRPNMHGLTTEQSKARISRWSGVLKKTGYNQAMEVFKDERNFTWRPYSYRLINWVEPEWYNMKSHVIIIEAAKTPDYVLDFLLLVSCTYIEGLSTDGDIVPEIYCPNRFARQFGFDQGVPGEIEAHRGFNCNDRSNFGVQVCIPGITRNGNPRSEYIDWWKNFTDIYDKTLREWLIPKATMENDENGDRKNSKEDKCNNNKSKKRKAEETNDNSPVTIEEEQNETLESSYPFRKKSVCKAPDIINIDSDDEENPIIHDDKASDIDESEMALNKELEEFQRLGLMEYQEMSPELEERNKIQSVKCKEDPYGQEAIEQYPNLFRLIRQFPHYEGHLEGEEITEDMKKDVFLGHWYMLISLMKEALGTNIETSAKEVEQMFHRAQMLEKNGFDVRHLVAHLKLLQRKTLEKK